MLGYNVTLRGGVSFTTEGLGLSVQFNGRAGSNGDTLLTQPMSLPLPPRGVGSPSGGIPDFIRTLYQTILDRDPESQTAIDYWTSYTYKHGLASTVGGFFTSAEYSAKGASPEATVEKFYNAVLGRQAEPGGKEFYVNKIRTGMSLGEVAEEFFGSREYRQRVQAGTAPGPIHRP